MKSLYFDNAATSWPKPGGVARAISQTICRGGGNPGRSGHAKALEAGRTVLAAREDIARVFNIRDSSRIIFTKNATEALNTALVGILGAQDQVVTTSMEHNSVLRPLTALAAKGVIVDIISADPGGEVDIEELCSKVTSATRLVCVIHASNVTGAINNVAKVGAYCRMRNVPLLVDASQTAGCIPIDVEQMGIDLLAFSGHKGLLGPQGTGGLYVKDEELLTPLTRGGTGSNSDREDQPEFMPDKFESGTLNVPGLAGLREGVSFIMRKTVQSVELHDQLLRERFLDVVSGDTRIITYEGVPSCRHTGVISVNISGVSPSMVGELLERNHGVLTRVGLHCAPRAHRTLGTFPDGTVRLSWGPFTQERDVLTAAQALRKLARGR